MNKYYYRKSHRFPVRHVVRVFGIVMIFIGIGVVGYIFFPLVIWQLTLAPAFASQGLSSPIPRTTIVNTVTIKSLLANGFSSLGKNYDDAGTWFSNEQAHLGHYLVDNYSISIPSINVNNAVVSTADTDLGKHMVQLGGSALPPDKGTTVVFGHSTLPQLFDPSNYHTILANAYKIKIGDMFYVTVNNVTYPYKVYNLLVVNPDDTSVLIPHFDNRYFELITCTPPGTVWQRLVIQARLQNI